MTLHKFSASFNTQSPAFNAELAVPLHKGGADAIEHRLIMQSCLSRADTYAHVLRSARLQDSKHLAVQV